ncbi:MAG: hypothetical protein K2X99_06050, partial [Gemmatimonadaceae bacterium]|nr:hypothetical protein [Gemmatimonadaceae bacterium]
RDALADGHRRAARYRTQTTAERFHVYDRAGDPCDRCEAPIRALPQGGRTTYWCAGCQRR